MRQPAAIRAGASATDVRGGAATHAQSDARASAGPAGVRYEMECEGLRVCSLLLLKSGYAKPPRPGDGSFQNIEHFTGKLPPVSGKLDNIRVFTPALSQTEVQSDMNTP